MERRPHSQLSWNERGQLWLRLGIRTALFLAAILLTAYVLLPLLSLLSPFMLALIFAWILNSPVRWLQRKLSISRKIVSMVLVILVFAVIGGVLFGVGWVAIYEVRTLFENRQSVLDELIGGLTAVADSITVWLNRLGSTLPRGLIPADFDLSTSISDWFQSLDLSSWVSQMAGRAPSMVSSLSSFSVALVVFIMASYCITGDYPRLRFLITDQVPTSTKDFFGSVRTVFMEAFGGYLKSQLLLSLGVFLILTIGFLVIGETYGLLMAFGLGVLDFIPIIGAGTVMVPWAMVDLILGEYGQAIELMVIWGIIALFRRLAEPKILGNQMGLDPILSLVGIYVGMRVAGVLGMIVGPLLLLVFLNLCKLGIFRPVTDDLHLAAVDVASILRNGKTKPEK